MGFRLVAIGPISVLLTILPIRDIARVIILIPNQRRRGDHTVTLAIFVTASVV